MEEYMVKIQEYSMLYGMNVLAALLIFVIGKWVARIITNVLEKLMLKAKIDATLVRFVKNISYAVMLVFVIVAAISKVGVETTSLVAMLGAAGLAVGLALQGSLANFAAGVLLIIFKPFKIGDLVQVCGELGVVQHIEIFNTTIHTPDNRKIITPNAQVTGGNIVNYSSVSQRRVDMVFGISYTDNIKDAKEALEGVLASNDLDCSGLPPTDETVCDYDEGFIAGILNHYTKKKFEVKEIDCWASGKQTCRFRAKIIS